MSVQFSIPYAFKSKRASAEAALRQAGVWGMSLLSINTSPCRSVSLQAGFHVDRRSWLC